MAVLGTVVTRFLPFLLFPESKQPPRVIEYLGKVLPYAMTGLLVVYSLKGVQPLSGSHGIPRGDRHHRDRVAAPMEEEHAAVDCGRHHRLHAAHPTDIRRVDASMMWCGAVIIERVWRQGGP